MVVLRVETGTYTLAIIILFRDPWCVCVCVCTWKYEERERNQLNCEIFLDHQLSHNGQSKHLSSF